MSRQIDVNNPDSWTDDDKDYLRERLDTVPPEHRSLLRVDVPVSPDAMAQSPDITKLAAFLRENFPEEMVTGLSAVDVAIQLLSEDDDEMSATGSVDNYDDWKISELKSECDTRIPPVEYTERAKKDELITALREWDAAHPTT